jgi:uncharacterized protein (TIGR04255 family)
MAAAELGQAASAQAVAGFVTSHGGQGTSVVMQRATAPEQSIETPETVLCDLNQVTKADPMAYARAPITEAVIELRFATTFPQTTVEDAGRRLRDDYFYLDPESIVQIKFEPAAQKAEPSAKWSGVRLSSLERVDSVFFRQNTFICSRLAPYTGWGDFFARTVRAWEVWRKSAGHTPLSRIGVRYINRIDIPVENVTLVRLEDYLNVFPKSPADLGAPLSAYAMQVTRPLNADDCVLTLTTATVAPPLIGFVSLVLDLDVFREANLPQRDDDMWDILTRMRGHKNRIFESCITDRARALFD